MEDNHDNCFVSYHTAAHTDAVLLKAPTKHYHAADRWVRREQRQYYNIMATWGKVRRELDISNSKRKEKVRPTAMQHEPHFVLC